MRAMALRRSSSLTGTDSHPEARSCPRVAGLGWAPWAAAFDVMGPTYRRLRHVVPASSAPGLDLLTATVQPVAVRIRLFLSLMAAIALVVVGTVIVANQFKSADGEADELAGGSGSSTSTTLID